MMLASVGEPAAEIAPDTTGVAGAAVFQTATSPSNVEKSSAPLSHISNVVSTMLDVGWNSIPKSMVAPPVTGKVERQHQMRLGPLRPTPWSDKRLL